MVDFWTKLIAGSPACKTRLHDQRGEIVSASRLLRNGPRALATGLMRLAFDHRPVKPWISYDAQIVLGGRLTGTSRVLEFGSGMSTAWYAERAAQVVSIEDYRPWYDKVDTILRGRGIANVRYRFAAGEEDYIAAARAEAGDGFDLVMIDGSHRHLCADLAIGIVRPGGVIYLDNADKHPEGTITGDCAAARETLLAHAARTGGEVRWFTDFAPTQMFVQTGLMVGEP